MLIKVACTSAAIVNELGLDYDFYYNMSSENTELLTLAIGTCCREINRQPIWRLNGGPAFQRLRLELSQLAIGNLHDEQAKRNRRAFDLRAC